MQKLLFTIVLIIGCICCRTADPLNIERSHYSGNSLRVDGYFFHEMDQVFHSFVLFKNGVFMSYGYNDNINSLKQLDSLILDEELVLRLKKVQYGWGVFKILNNNILRTYIHLYTKIISTPFSRRHNSTTHPLFLNNYLRQNYLSKKAEVKYVGYKL